jgi:cytochrome c oxidase subunit I
MAYMAALHFWWPKISGRMYPRFWGAISAGLIFVGFNFTFFPQFILGYLGMPRRYYSYSEEFQALNVLSTAGASVLGFGYLLPLIYMIWSIKKGRPAGDNPWNATGLEWKSSSPPPVHNFDQPVVVTEGPYNYTETPEDEV